LALDVGDEGRIRKQMEKYVKKVAEATKDTFELVNIDLKNKG
jgi:hypothetical protein